MNHWRRCARATIVALIVCALGACRPRVESAPRSFDQSVEELVRCVFDDPSAMLAPHGQAALEASIRRALREDRYRFSIRAGRCGGALDERLRTSDPRARALGDAWDALLPLAQAQAPDDIALERAIRRIGVAFRGARGR